MSTAEVVVSKRERLEGGDRFVARALVWMLAGGALAGAALVTLVPAEEHRESERKEAPGAHSALPRVPHAGGNAQKQLARARTDGNAQHANARPRRQSDTGAPVRAQALGETQTVVLRRAEALDALTNEPAELPRPAPGAIDASRLVEPSSDVVEPPPESEEEATARAARRISRAALENESDAPRRILSPEERRALTED